MKEEMDRGGEKFYFMHTLIEVTADDAGTLEQRVSGIETLCTSLDMVAKCCDYRHEQGFLFCPCRQIRSPGCPPITAS